MLNAILQKDLAEYDEWSLLGRGSFSDVYRVRERSTGRLLACKVIASQDLAIREKEFLEKVCHPLFPQFERFEQLQGKFYVFMEYIPGVTLKEFITRRGVLTGRQAAQLGVVLADGLLYLHEQRNPVIYRDLKPENVLIQQDGRVRLIDLGCACFVEEKKNTMAGTRGYAAPEQLEEKRKAGVESDVYALGKNLQYALGVEIFVNRRGMARVLYKRHKRSRVSREFARLLADMTKTERRQRVQDMRICLHRLECVKRLEKKKGIKRMCALIMMSRKRHKGELDFYYEKNINRGT